MAKVAIPLGIDQNGDTTLGPFTFQDQTGANIDFTGYTARFRVNQSSASTSTNYLSLASGSGITLGGTAGTITIVITHAQSLNLPVGTLYYDLMLTDGLGSQAYWMAGPFIVESTITR